MHAAVLSRSIVERMDKAAGQTRVRAVSGWCLRLDAGNCGWAFNDDFISETLSGKTRYREDVCQAESPNLRIVSG